MRNTHITEQEWVGFWQQQLGEEEQSELLAHVCDCEQCSFKMANGIPKEWQLTAPAYLKKETVQYVRQRTRLQRFFDRRQLQLFTYSLKVGVAMAAALLLVLQMELPTASLSEQTTGEKWEESATLQEENEDFSITNFLNKGTHYINQKLNNFSSSFFDKEDINHEK